jgi:hypothetical protein
VVRLFWCVIANSRSYRIPGPLDAIGRCAELSNGKWLPGKPPIGAQLASRQLLQTARTRAGTPQKISCRMSSPKITYRSLCFAWRCCFRFPQTPFGSSRRWPSRFYSRPADGAQGALVNHWLAVHRGPSNGAPGVRYGFCAGFGGEGPRPGPGLITLIRRSAGEPRGPRRIGGGQPVA